MILHRQGRHSYSTFQRARTWRLMRLSNQPKASEIIANDTRKGNTPFCVSRYSPRYLFSKSKCTIVDGFSRAGEGSEGFQQLEAGPLTGLAGPPSHAGRACPWALCFLFMLIPWAGRQVVKAVLHLSHQVHRSRSKRPGGSSYISTPDVKNSTQMSWLALSKWGQCLHCSQCTTL